MRLIKDQFIFLGF